MQFYTETQQNKYRWYLVCFLILSEGLFLIWFFSRFAALFKDPLLSLAPIVGFCLFNGFCSLVFFQQLSVRIDHAGVHYQVPFSGSKWQHIPWQEIDRLYVREVALLGEYPRGFLGFRQGPNGFAYAPKMGLFGLQIEKATGGKYLLGTQRPDELKQFLMNRSASKPVSTA